VAIGLAIVAGTQADLRATAVVSLVGVPVLVLALNRVLLPVRLRRLVSGPGVEAIEAAPVGEALAAPGVGVRRTNVVCVPAEIAASVRSAGRAAQSGATGTIVLRSALHQADPDLVRFVVAHEAGHLARGDSRLLALMIGGLAGILDAVLLAATSPLWLLLVVPALAALVAASWHRELACDGIGLRATGPLSAASFIAYLARVDQLRPGGNPWRRLRPWLTHPPTNVRRRHLARVGRRLAAPPVPAADLLGAGPGVPRAG
jgi:Zn-dependent protease with chaperone function